MRQRGAIVYRDLRPSGFPLSFWIVGSFFAGIAALILSLEFSITMEDRRVLDPPLQPTESSSDEDFLWWPTDTLGRCRVALLGQFDFETNGGPSFSP
jgi:hypothetical protein